jgi:hypothetical protein
MVRLSGSPGLVVIRSSSSCPALCRASTSYLPLSKKDVDGRDKSGHDEKLR